MRLRRNKMLPQRNCIFYEVMIFEENSTVNHREEKCCRRRLATF